MLRRLGSSHARALRRFVLPLFAVVTLAPSAGATLVPRLTPDEVDRRAARIVEALCVQARPGAVPGASFPVTEYVFRVERIMKWEGEGVAGPPPAPGQSLVVKQVGGTSATGARYEIVGLPTYAVGRRYRLALNGDSQLGLTSPVGFALGVRVLGDETPAAPERKP